MSTATETSAMPLPLTVLTDEEKMFQSTIRKFARERIGPHVRAMDEAGAFREDLLHEMFELGLMGIEIPEQYGGQGGTFFQSVLSVEALAAVDPSAAESFAMASGESSTACLISSAVSGVEFLAKS
jgi:butyryl-CoA dehydrogenase/short/branched chain acyl-CoA dehydrogenase